MGEDWENKAYVICERLLGDEKYRKRLTKIAQVGISSFIRFHR